MTRTSFILVFIIICITSFSQGFNTEKYVGVALGKESFIGLPKFGIMMNFPTKRVSYDPSLSKSKSSFYLGTDVSFFGLVLMVVSPSVVGGYKYKMLTIENSLSYAYAGVSPQATVQWASLNPKLGIKLGPVWLKAGPCFEIWNQGEKNIDNLLRIGRYNYNVNLLFFLRSGRYRY